jgi:Domain of unknown function (DUF4124)
MKRLLLLAVLVTWSGMASAVVYKWTDAQGKIQYGDRPPDGVHAEIVDTLVANRGSNGRSTTSSVTPQANTKAPGAPASSPADSSSKDAQQVADDVAQVKAKQCTEAQERYKKLIEGRRIYKTSENGERQYLTSDQIDSERLTAKQDVDTACNGTT